MELFPLFIISNKTFCPYIIYRDIYKHMQYNIFRRYAIHILYYTLLTLGEVRLSC